jgi:hypothetical protein
MPEALPNHEVRLTDVERRTLERLACQCLGRSPEARRAQIILALADGKSITEIRRDLACSHQTVAVWRRRFLKLRLQGLTRSALHLALNEANAAPLQRRGN